MDPIKRFAEYADAFEKAYASDDWSIVEPYFTDDAVYEIVGEAPLASLVEGRDAVLAHFKRSVDAFDRRFDSRAIDLLEGPELREGAVWLHWRGVYAIAGAPDLAIEGEEIVSFEGDRIRRLEDRYADGAAAPVVSYMESHGAKLHPVGGPG